MANILLNAVYFPSVIKCSHSTLQLTVTSFTDILTTISNQQTIFTIAQYPYSCIYTVQNILFQYPDISKKLAKRTKWIVFLQTVYSSLFPYVKRSHKISNSTLHKTLFVNTFVGTEACCFFTGAPESLLYPTISTNHCHLLLQPTVQSYIA